MKKAIFIVLFSFTAGFVVGQVKYKDLAEAFPDMTRDEMKIELREYLLTDLDHPNANFRLALIYASNYRVSDVLTHYEYAMANAAQARLRFTKAKQLVDEREVDHNNEYYAPLFNTVDAKGRPYATYAAVSDKINKGLDSASQFLDNVPMIYLAFTRSVANYDRAVKLFSEINSEFTSLDDVYLYFDPDFDKKLDLLKHSYDSARIYFDRYMALTQAYPILYHKQKYHIKPIVTYRLDGLITRMNFLTPDVEFWDYGSWVDRVRKSVAEEILSLRTRTSQNEIRLSANLVKIAASNGEGVTILPLDKQVVFNLNNYDKQSLVLALLEYKHFKQDWLIKEKAFVPDTVNGERNALLYSALVYANRTADTLMTAVRTRATRDKIRKHQEFITQHYGGAEGLQKYVTDEQEHIKVTYEQYTGGLRSALVNMATAMTTADGGKTVRFANHWNVSTVVQTPTPELLAKGEPLTLQSRRSPDGSLYLAGTYRPDKKTNLKQTFVARVHGDGKPAWMHSFSFKVDSLSPAADANNQLGPFELTQEGCVVVVRSVHASKPGARNTMVYLNEKGEEKFHLRLADRSVPRQLNFSERSNSFVLLLKGNEDAPSFTAPENLVLVGINAIGDKLWRRQVSLTGGITGFVNLIDGHMLAGNYTLLKDLTGKEHAARTGESSPFLVKFNDKGDIERIQPIATAKPVFMTHLIKVSDRSINLIGVEGTRETAALKTLSGDMAVVHIMSNRLCEVVTSNVLR